MGKIRVVLVDDHRMVRSGLRKIIDSEADMTVIAEADDGYEAIRLAQELQPHILVLDISMPRLNGLEAAGTIKQTIPTVQILALTRYSDKAYLEELLHAGISGYVLKQSESEVMLRAIRSIASGSQYLDPAVTESIFSLVTAAPGKRSTGISPKSLTDRESDVLRRVARGYSNKEIAGQLEVSLKSVEMQKASALKKLNIRGRNEIVDYAIHQGWFREDV